MVELHAQASDYELARSTLVPLPAHAFAHQHCTDVPPQMRVVQASGRWYCAVLLCHARPTRILVRTLQAGAHLNNPPPLHQNKRLLPDALQKQDTCTQHLSQPNDCLRRTRQHNVKPHDSDPL